SFHEAYAEAQRAVRPLRIFMRAHWEEATKDLDTPTGSPYAVSFYTLPHHWKFMDLVRQGKAGANMLPNGDFEEQPNRVPQAWLPQETTLDEVDLIARRASADPKEGKQCLMPQVKPKGVQVAPPAALERKFREINSSV